MILTYSKKNNEEQTIDFKAQVTEMELNFLMNFAINSLMEIGAIKVQELLDVPQEVQLPITETLVPPTQVN